jgi:pimeloyl-ACP methyl ester carboxylesterase
LFFSNPGKLWEGVPSSDSKGGRLPIICLHGWGDNVAAFDPLLPHIVQDREQTAFAFDMTGHGKSYHTPGPFTDLHVENLITLLRIIRHYKWDKVNLVGHSFGGLVGLSFASTFPE